jgi:hypothetical protein
MREIQETKTLFTPLGHLLASVVSCAEDGHAKLAKSWIFSYLMVKVNKFQRHLK